MSNCWNILVIRLQLMKVWLSSSEKWYLEYHKDQPSLSKCSQEYSSATESMSSLEYLRLNSSNTKVLNEEEKPGQVKKVLLSQAKRS